MDDYDKAAKEACSCCLCSSGHTFCGQNCLERDAGCRRDAIVKAIKAAVEDALVNHLLYG